jgi:hypothetical protein
MPFTPAHPAIVVPLARWRRRSFVLSALVVGSMSPDFEYFVRMRPVRTIGHDLIGIPLLCVPSGWLVLMIFEYVMKGPMIELFPGPHRRRLLPYRSPIPMALWPLILLSLAIGAFSHIAWDSFTHENGWVVLRVPLPATTVLSIHGQQLKTFKLLQYGSTSIGLMLLASWYWGWFHRNRESVEPPGPRLTDLARSGVILTLAVSSCGIGLVAANLSSSDGLYRMTGRLVTATITGFCIITLGYCVLYRCLGSSPIIDPRDGA